MSKGTGAEQSLKQAHRTASKKVSRLINEGKYELNETNARKGMNLISKTGSISDDVARKLDTSMTDADTKAEDSAYASIMNDAHNNIM